MNNKVLNGVIELISQETKIIPPNKLNGETTIEELNMDSISFIKLIVELEEKFEFQFDDEKLIYTAFKDIESIADYVSSKI